MAYRMKLLKGVLGTGERQVLVEVERLGEIQGQVTDLDMIVIPVGVRITVHRSRFLSSEARQITVFLCESRFRRGRITACVTRITVSITLFQWAGQVFSQLSWVERTRDADA